MGFATTSRMFISAFPFPPYFFSSSVYWKSSSKDCQCIFGTFKSVETRTTQVILVTCVGILPQYSHQVQLPVETVRRLKALGSADWLTPPSSEGSHSSPEGKSLLLWHFATVTSHFKADLRDLPSLKDWTPESQVLAPNGLVVCVDSFGEGRALFINGFRYLSQRCISPATMNNGIPGSNVDMDPEYFISIPRPTFAWTQCYAIVIWCCADASCSTRLSSDDWSEIDSPGGISAALRSDKNNKCVVWQNTSESGSLTVHCKTLGVNGPKKSEFSPHTSKLNDRREKSHRFFQNHSHCS